MPFIEALHTTGRRVRSGLLRRPIEESFATLTLVSAVVTVLVVRLFLEWTGYPQVGNDTLHVAHVLWGGLLMLVAGRLSLAFYGAGIRRLSAALLGIGFGLFVDEIGKFITRDQDYFFRPAAALIYVSFVLLYLAAGGVRRFLPAGDCALLCGAIERLEDAVRGDLQPGQKAAALAALDRVAASGSSHGDLARQLRLLVEGQAPVAPRSPFALARHAAAARRRLPAFPWHQRWPLWLLVGATALGLLNSAGQLLAVTWMSLSAWGGWWVPEPDFTAVVLQGSVSAIAGAFFLRGLWALRRDTCAGIPAPGCA